MGLFPEIPKQTFGEKSSACDRAVCQRAINVARKSLDGLDYEETRKKLETDMENVYLKAGCDPKICLPLARLRKR